jgi:hypothetical protein
MTALIDVPCSVSRGAAAVRRVARPATGWLVALLGTVMFAAGCTGSPSGQGPSGAPSKQALPPQCTHTVTQAGDVAAALDGAAPGDTVCFSGSGLADTDMVMTHSGTAAAPITLAADGATVQEVQIKADHVTLQGFTVTGGGGVLLQGAGLTARNNIVHDTEQGGITCDPCTDSAIESNTISHAATNGIDITGQRITVHANSISDTVVGRHGGDADGMRFFGNGHQITDNTVSDISAEGYSRGAPHPDCFQTLDNSKPPTFDVTISSNTCRNVDAQCLIATGDQDGNSRAPSGVPSITFVKNNCANNGAQAVNVRHWPNVVVEQNTFSGPNLTRAVLISEGSTGCTVVGNTTTENRPTVEVDASSRPGAHVEDNSPS